MSPKEGAPGKDSGVLRFPATCLWFMEPRSGSHGMPELEALNDHNVPLKETGPEWRGDLGQVRPGALPMPAVDRPST